MDKLEQRTNLKNIPRIQIKKVLVPLDGSKNSKKGLLTAIHLAAEHEASLTAIHVLNPSEKKYKQNDLDYMPPFFILQAKKLAMKKRIPFESTIKVGDPGHSIVRYAHKNNIDLIVIGARGMSTFKKIFLGSVSDYVMQKAKISVVLIK